MEKPLFSILIANFNNGHFFKDCYKSIIAQTYQNWEVIIVDDGSSDNSIKLINELISNDNRFKLFIRKNNEGCGYTKRECVTYASGSIAGFLDPDDTLVEDALNLMVKTYLKKPHITFISSNYQLVNLDLTIISTGTHATAIPVNTNYLSYGRGAITHFTTFKVSNYRQTVGINPLMKRAVDQDLYYKLEEVGKHHFLNAVLYNYRINDNSISANDNLYKARYWHLFAKKNAYSRRLKTKFESIDVRKLDREFAAYYIKRFEKLKFTNNFSSKMYHLCQAFKYDFFYSLKFKCKSLVLLIIGKI